jgi:hypothetical protein
MTRYAPLWQQAGSYAASLDRMLMSTLWPSGGASGAPAAAVANTMTVSVPPGTLVVPLQAGQGAALCRWDAAEVVTIAAAPASGNSRIDLVIAQVRDNALDAGGNNDFIFTNVTGTPAASNPAVPATPTNALVVCQVLVPGAVANLNTATLTDRRPVGHAEVWQSVAEGYPSTAWQALGLDRDEGGNGYDHTRQGYVVVMPGRYRVESCVTWDRSAAVVTTVYKNGSEVKRGPTMSAGASAAGSSVSSVIACVAGDLLQVWALTNPAANTTPGQFLTWAAFTYIGP